MLLQLYMNPKRNHHGSHTRMYGDTNISVYKIYHNGSDMKGLMLIIRHRQLSTSNSRENSQFNKNDRRIHLILSTHRISIEINPSMKDF